MADLNHYTFMAEMPQEFRRIRLYGWETTALVVLALALVAFLRY